MAELKVHKKGILVGGAIGAGLVLFGIGFLAGYVWRGGLSPEEKGGPPVPRSPKVSTSDLAGKWKLEEIDGKAIEGEFFDFDSKGSWDILFPPGRSLPFCFHVRGRQHLHHHGT